MKKIDRRQFIRTGLAGIAGFSVINAGIIQGCTVVPEIIGQVELGNTGVTVSQIAMGTGTVGYNNGSNQTRLGMEKFVGMLRHGYERGIRFFDMADGYGSHSYVGEGIKPYAREDVVLMTKIWTSPDGSDNLQSVEETLNRYRKEMGVDYIDIVLMHCMMNGNWAKDRTHYMEGLERAKQRGIIRVTGVSCHNIDALAEAAENPWVDVIMARLNPFGAHMDGTVDEVNAILAKAVAKGKGVIGMKVFGEGKHITEAEREQSIKFNLTEGNVHCLTLGLESIEQMDDAVDRVLRLSKL